MSKIGPEEVKRLAALSKIALSDDEVTAMAAELGTIVEFVEQLQGVDIKDVPTTDQVTGLVDVWRPDEVRQGGPSQAELLKNAPMTKDGYIKVRRVLG